MFPLARSSVPMTPSITSLMLRTPSSSRRSWVSRTSSASKGSFSFPPGPGVGVLGVLGVLGLSSFSAMVVCMGCTGPVLGAMGDDVADKAGSRSAILDRRVVCLPRLLPNASKTRLGTTRIDWPGASGVGWGRASSTVTSSSLHSAPSHSILRPGRLPTPWSIALKRQYQFTSSPIPSSHHPACFPLSIFCSSRLVLFW